MSALLRRPGILAPARRAFSTSTPRLAGLQWEGNHHEVLGDNVPRYPYGPPSVYKQSRKGLYGGQRIRFGNKVSRKENKSRRSWRPNILSKRLFSKSLNRHVQLKVSSRVLRTIDKLGGLDEYLLGEKEARIKELGESGWWLRWAIMQTPAVKKRFAAEREALGLPASEEEFSVMEEDAEAVREASTPDAEIAELTIDENADPEAEPAPLVSEVLAEDDVFQVEQSKDLPPLRFRVGHRQYIMLTDQGWRSLVPSTLNSEKRPTKANLRAAERWRDQMMEGGFDEVRARLEKVLMEEEIEAGLARRDAVRAERAARAEKAAAAGETPPRIRSRRRKQSPEVGDEGAVQPGQQVTEKPFISQMQQFRVTREMAAASPLLEKLYKQEVNKQMKEMINEKSQLQVRLKGAHEFEAAQKIQATQGIEATQQKKVEQL